MIEFAEKEGRSNLLFQAEADAMCALSIGVACHVPDVTVPTVAMSVPMSFALAIEPASIVLVTEPADKLAAPPDEMFTQFASKTPPCSCQFWRVSTW